MKTLKRQKLATLLSKIVDGRAENTDMEALDLLMFEDEDAQTYYLHYLAVHNGLERLGDGTDQLTPHGKKASRPWKITTLAAAACLFLAAGIGFWMASRKPPITSAPISARPSAFEIQNKEVLAVIGSVHQAEWSLSESPPSRGTRLGRGQIHLRSGRLRLDFTAGEKVTIEGPALFEVIDHQRLKLDEGKLVASVTEGGSGFTVIMPNGALVDLGTEFAVTVTAAGESYVRVIKGMVMASSTNQQGNTSWEELLKGGDEYFMVKNAPPREKAFLGQVPIALESEIPPLALDAAYSRTVVESRPLAYWRFDDAQDAYEVPSELGDSPMQLGGTAAISPSGFLRLDSLERAYAISSKAFDQLNSASGCSLELWAISDSVEWQTLAGLVLEGPRPIRLLPSLVRHNPHLLLLERAGVSGSNWHHIHPNFAMRSVLHSPLAYTGGVNSYSEADYLIHTWHHFVLVHQAGHLQIYVDGTLSGSTTSAAQFDQLSYKLLLGRLHTLPTQADARAWSGAIDEVALYDKALSTQEVKQHFEAAKR